MPIDQQDIQNVTSRLKMVGYEPTKELEKQIEKVLKAGDRASYKPDSELFKAYEEFVGPIWEEYREHPTNSYYVKRVRESWEHLSALVEREEAAHPAQRAEHGHGHDHGHAHTPPPLPGTPTAHAVHHTEGPRPTEKPRRSAGALFRWMVLVPLLILASFLLGRYVWPSMAMVAKKADAQCTAKIAAAKTTWEEACQSLQTQAYDEGQQYVYQNLERSGLKARPKVVIDHN